MSLFGSKPATTAALQPGATAGFSLNSAASTQSQPTTLGFSTNAFQNSTLASSANSTNSTGLKASQLPSSMPDAPPAKVLKDLLDSANSLPKLNHGSIGPIHLTLNDLQKETQALRNKEKANDSYTKAHYLLSRSGINAAELENELNVLPKHGAINPDTKFANLVNLQRSAADAEDIESFLLAKKDENILSAIEQSLSSAAKDFDDFINENVSIDWRIRKEQLKKTLGIPLKQKITSEELEKSFSWNNALPENYRILSPLTQSLPSASKQPSREKFEGCASVVYNLNEKRLQGAAFPVCLSFEDLAKRSTDSKSKQMSEIWKILSDFCNEKYTKTSQELQFFDDYHKNADSSVLNKRIVQTSKTFLEQMFFNYMDEIYTKEDKKPENLQTPTNVNKVSFFIHSVISKNNDAELMKRTLIYNGTPIWALLYYLMRSGLYEEAVNLTKSNRAAFDKFDQNFPIYLSHFVKSGNIGLPSEVQARFTSDYSQTYAFLDEKSKDFDPFKYAVCKIIGKCDLAKKQLPSELNLCIEDWLWFHLLIINEFNNEFLPNFLFEKYTLRDLQTKVLNLGPDKFNASSSYSLYVRTLILLGLYEVTVQFVYENISECDAVHLGIALCYYGLLKTPQGNHDKLVVANPKGGIEINFSRLLGSYTRSFKISDPKVAAQYLILICVARGGKDSEVVNQCHEALRELVLVSREYGPLLGDLNNETGEVTPGILEKQRSLFGLENLSSYQNKIIGLSAKRCEEEGRIFDALRLRQLCQEYDTVVVLINKYLSELLSMTDLSTPLIEESSFQTTSGELQPANTSENNLLSLSKHVIGVFKKNLFILEKVTPKVREVNDYLLQIVDIREQFVKKDWRGAFESLERLRLIPIEFNDNFVEIRQASELLNGYDTSLVKVVPSLLILAMTCISQLYHEAVTRKFGFAVQGNGDVERLRAVAKNLMVYAGMVQYKMPRETYSLLVGMEASL